MPVPASYHNGPTKGNVLPCTVCVPGQRMAQDMAMD